MALRHGISCVTLYRAWLLRLGRLRCLETVHACLHAGRRHLSHRRLHLARLYAGVLAWLHHGTRWRVTWRHLLHRRVWCTVLLLWMLLLLLMLLRVLLLLLLMLLMLLLLMLLLLMLLMLLLLMLLLLVLWLP